MKLASALHCLLLLVVTVAAPGTAQPAPWDTPFGAEAATLLHAAQELPPAPDADVQVITQDMTLHFDEQGRATRTRYLVYRVLSAAAVDSWGSVESSWSPWYQERPQIRARVVTAAGTEHLLDPATLAELPASETESLLSDRRLLRAPLPAMAPGVVVEEEHVLRETQPLFEAGVVHSVSMAWTVPVQRLRLVVEAPSELPLSFSRDLLPELEPVRNPGDANQGNRVRWTFERLDPPEATLPESSLPPGVATWPRIQVATGRTWNDVATLYHRIVEQQLTNGQAADLETTARAIVAQIDGRSERIAALLAWVQQRVRYTGLEFGESAIVPYTPAETLDRHYGDCKDKATLLVGLLRAAGFDASVALLSVGPGLDVSAEMVGLGEFDHAIVYLPPNGDHGAVWIDPTDEFARAGELPLGDQNRLALVAAPTTDGLLRTPVAESGSNLLSEERDIYLQELGPGRVIERSRLSGSVERAYRHDYSRLTEADRSDALGSYARDYYSAQEVVGLSISPLDDLAQPLTLSVEVDRASIAFTDLADAAVAINPYSLFYRLPDWLLQASGDRPPRQHDLELAEPFRAEWRYHIHPPDGYRSLSLPPARDQELGPARLHYRFENLPDGSVEARLSFDTGARRCSAEEAEELISGVHDVLQEDPILLYFEHVGETHLVSGQVREALAEFRRLADAQPGRALPRTRIARALLEAGLGEAARREARAAVKLEPGLAIAHQALGIVLNHDLIGRPFGPGWTPEGTEAAYRQAKRLEPDSLIHRQNLAVILEYNHAGRRYGPGARLDEAIEEYQALRAQGESSLDNNLLIALLRAERFDDVLALGRELDLEVNESPLLLAALTATRGSGAAIREALKLQDAQRRSTQLAATTASLLQLRLYAQAAEILTVAAKGSPNAAQLLGRANALRRTRRIEDLDLDLATPEGFVRGLLARSISDGVDELLPLYSDLVRDDLAPREIERERRDLRVIAETVQQTTVPLTAVADIALGNVDIVIEGDDTSGYYARVLSTLDQSDHLFFVRQPDGFRLLTLGDPTVPVGLQALHYLQQGNTDAARQWLLRATNVRPQEDDDFPGPPARVLLGTDPPADPGRLRAVAGALLSHQETSASRALDLLSTAAKGETPAGLDATTFQQQVRMARIQALIQLERYQEATDLLSDLSMAFPDSDSLFRVRVNLLLQLEAWEESRKLLKTRLAQNPDSPDLLAYLANWHQAQGQLQESEAIYRDLLAQGKATSSMLNSLAWSQLIRDAVSKQTIDYAQRSVQMGQQGDPNHLHTLASVYAEVGRVQEAREILLQGMKVAGAEHPTSADWYVLGRIAEQFGVREAAADAYRKVEGNEDSSHLSVYQLAQRRLQVLSTKASK